MDKLKYTFKVKSFNRKKQHRKDSNKQDLCYCMLVWLLLFVLIGIQQGCLLNMQLYFWSLQFFLQLRASIVWVSTDSQPSYKHPINQYEIIQSIMKTRFLHRLLLLISILAYVQTTHISDHSHANSGDFEHGPFPRRVKIVHFKNSDMGLVPAGKNVKLSYIRDENDHFIWIAYKNKDNTYSFQTSEGLMLHCPDFPKGNGQLLTLQYPDGIINQSFLVDYLQYPTYGYYRIRCRQYEEPFLAVDGRDGAMLAVDRYQQENRTAWQLI